MAIHAGCSGEVRNGWFRRPLLIPCLTLFALSLSLSQVAAQTRSSREQLDQLLESLIESEIERRDLEPTRRSTPEIVKEPEVRLSARDIGEARKLIQSFSREADSLMYELADQDRAVGGLREMVNDALQIRAALSVLAQRAERSQDGFDIRQEVQLLDRNWRAMSHTLKATRNLPDRVTGSVQNLDNLDRRLIELFQFAPQLDVRELMRQTFALGADLDNLVEDIEIELGDSAEGRQMLIDSHRVQQQAQLLGRQIASQPTHSILIDEYKRFRDLWYPLETRLRSVENRYIERDVRRIRSTDHKLNELLWLEEQVDRQQLLHLTGTLTKDVDEFFARTPLKLLINLPDGYTVIPLADEFYGVLQNFADVVNRNESQEDVFAAYQYVNESGEEFVTTFGKINSRAALSVLHEIEHSLESLRESLLLQGGQNQASARVMELAATIEILADHLDNDVNRWLNRKRVPFRTDALKESASFAQATHHLHEGLINGVDPEILRHEINDLFTGWRTVYGFLAKCDTEDRAVLARTASQITPALVELRTLLEP